MNNKRKMKKKLKKKTIKKKRKFADGCWPSLVNDQIIRQRLLIT
jgi:hypothetical protein